MRRDAVLMRMQSQRLPSGTERGERATREMDRTMESAVGVCVPLSMAGPMHGRRKSYAGAICVAFRQNAMVTVREGTQTLGERSLGESPSLGSESHGARAASGVGLPTLPSAFGGRVEIGAFG